MVIFLGPVYPLHIQGIRFQSCRTLYNHQILFLQMLFHILPELFEKSISKAAS